MEAAATGLAEISRATRPAGGMMESYRFNAGCSADAIKEV
jgi:hypothetical protein